MRLAEGRKEREAGQGEEKENPWPLLLLPCLFLFGNELIDLYISILVFTSSPAIQTFMIFLYP